MFLVVGASSKILMNQPYDDAMPMLGLGTWENKNPEQCRESVATALEMGYRHIDTAQIYGNEEAVGDGIERADVSRDDVFLATKIWIDNLSYDNVLRTFDASLQRLGVDYVDLLYVHWPSRAYDPAETLDAFNELYDDGRINHIGISNFEPAQVREAVEVSDAPIFANQVEIHPMLPQDELVEACRAEDVKLVAYSPLARGRVFDNDVVSRIANEHDVSEAQVALAWLRERGITAIPKATSEVHIRDNWESLDLSLSDEEMASLNGIGQHDRRVDPSFAPW